MELSRLRLSTVAAAEKQDLGGEGGPGGRLSLGVVLLLRSRTWGGRGGVIPLYGGGVNPL